MTLSLCFPWPLSVGSFEVFHPGSGRTKTPNSIISFFLDHMLKKMSLEGLRTNFI